MSDSDLQAFLNLLLSRYFLVQAIVKIQPRASKRGRWRITRITWTWSPS